MEVLLDMLFMNGTNDSSERFTGVLGIFVGEKMM
jgi:hypothetical protein